MDIFNITTEVIAIGASMGISALTGNIVGTVTTKSGNKVVDFICVGIGTLVIGGMVTEAANKYIHRQADELKESFSSVKEAVDNAKNEENV